MEIETREGQKGYEWVCPAKYCGVERTDYEGKDAHLPRCPNCDSDAVPVLRPSGWIVRCLRRNDLCRSARECRPSDQQDRHGQTIRFGSPGCLPLNYGVAFQSSGPLKTE